MIIQEYLNGLEDVKNTIDSILNNTFDQSNCKIPENIVDIMKKQINHIKILVDMFPEDDLSIYSNKVLEAENWILNKGE